MIGNVRKERKRGRLESGLLKIAGSFIKIENSSGALVTATRVEILEDLSFAKIFLSVFPENKEKEVLKEMKAKKKIFHEILLKKIKMRFLPSFTFEIDRQPALERRVEELLQQG